MRHRTIFVLSLLAAMLTFSARSSADSDGYFCSANGYLTYELREGITPGVVGHVLKVVRFDREHGIRNAGEVKLQDFQVHIMNCVGEQVEIAGYGTVPPGNDPPLTRCTIMIGDGQSGLSSPNCTAESVEYDSRRPEPLNLGQWARRKSIALDSPNPDQNYYLQLVASTKKLNESDSETHYKTELIRADKQGNILQRFVVYEARIMASDGE